MTETQEKQDRTQFDRLEIAEMIQRERNARDAGRWAEMASYYHPDSSVEVSWFRGGGAEFVERSRIQAERVKQQADGHERINFHEMGPAVVDVQGDRALAETACTLHSFFPLDSIPCKISGFVRLLWRAQRLGDKWLLAGLRCLYVRDYLTACDPTRQPSLDEAELSTYRLSYRYVTYNLARLGLAPKHDLPGADQPETVKALRKGELGWLWEQPWDGH